MKERFTACLTTLILSVFFSISASADVVEVDGICYDISENNATVTQGGDYSGDIVIPESITFENSKYSVTSIGDSAFQYCISLTSVTIPNSVTSIGDDAFRFCSGLTHPIIVNDMFVFLPTGYEGHYSIPENISTIIGGAFYERSSLTSVTIPNSVTSIGNYAFGECSGLTSVTIPNSVTSIGEGAFSGCTGLTSVTIPNSVTSIGKEAFAYCENIENVYCYAEEVPSTDHYAVSIR